MSYDFLECLSTPDVARVASDIGSLWKNVESNHPSALFSEREAVFIGLRDSFYLATVSPSGWPYIQHRGGPPGFLRMLDVTTLGFADYRGNRQYITTGNVARDDRVAVFLMDYPRRQRLKVLAHMRPHDLKDETDLTARLATPGYRALPERGFTLRLEAFDWNCPQHITPRFTTSDVEKAVAPLRARLALFEAENAELRLSPHRDTPSQTEPGENHDTQRHHRGPTAAVLPTPVQAQINQRGSRCRSTLRSSPLSRRCGMRR